MDTVAENRFVTRTDWDGYLKVLEAVEGNVRITYDRGALELMTPSIRHEYVKSVLGSFVETLMVELEIDFRFGGATTFRLPEADRGLEPDECYWLAEWQSVSEADAWDGELHPPPELAIEVEISASRLDRMGIYASLGVSELWRWRKAGRLEFYLRDAAGGFALSPTSLCFPWLESQAVQKLIEESHTLSDSGRIRAFRAWVRQHGHRPG